MKKHNIKSRRHLFFSFSRSLFAIGVLFFSCLLLRVPTLEAQEPEGLSMSPTSGSEIAVGDIITISGNNLSDATRVFMTIMHNGSPAGSRVHEDYFLYKNNQIKLIVPPTTSSGNLRVTNALAGRASAAALVGTFTCAPVLITDFTPKTAPPGGEIRLIGSGFPTSQRPPDSDIGAIMEVFFGSEKVGDDELTSGPQPYLDHLDEWGFYIDRSSTSNSLAGTSGGST